MMEERAKRKLSAILSADVKGYSRLMGENELATVRTLEAYREMIAEIIRNYSGRVVDSPGDNLLAEFSSVVDAVESAIEIQKELKSKNEELPEDRRMEFRTGINLGDVIRKTFYQSRYPQDCSGFLCGFLGQLLNFTIPDAVSHAMLHAGRGFS